MPRIRHVTLAGAAHYLRVNGHEPTRAHLLHYVRQGTLKADTATRTPWGQTYRSFSPATLRAFARAVGWEYVPRARAGRSTSAPFPSGSES